MAIDKAMTMAIDKAMTMVIDINCYIPYLSRVLNY